MANGTAPDIFEKATGRRIPFSPDVRRKPVGFESRIAIVDGQPEECWEIGSCLMMAFYPENDTPGRGRSGSW
jgi:hypothetical protein